MTTPTAPATAERRKHLFRVLMALVPIVFLVGYLTAVVLWFKNDLAEAEARRAADQARFEARNDATEQDVLKHLAAEGRNAQSANCMDNKCTVIIDSTPYTVLVQVGPDGEPVYGITDYQK